MSEAHWSDDLDPAIESAREAAFIRWLENRAALEALEAREQHEEETFEADGLAVELVKRSMAAM